MDAKTIFFSPVCSTEKAIDACYSVFGSLNSLPSKTEKFVILYASIVQFAWSCNPFYKLYYY